MPEACRRGRLPVRTGVRAAAGALVAAAGAIIADRGRCRSGHPRDHRPDRLHWRRRRQHRRQPAPGHRQHDDHAARPPTTASTTTLAPTSPSLTTGPTVEWDNAGGASGDQTADNARRRRAPATTTASGHTTAEAPTEDGADDQGADDDRNDDNGGDDGAHERRRRLPTADTTTEAATTTTTERRRPRRQATESTTTTAPRPEPATSEPATTNPDRERLPDHRDQQPGLRPGDLTAGMQDQLEASFDLRPTGRCDASGDPHRPGASPAFVNAYVVNDAMDVAELERPAGVDARWPDADDRQWHRRPRRRHLSVITAPDQAATNGVVHGISGALFVPELTPPRSLRQSHRPDRPLVRESSVAPAERTPEP